MSSHGTTMRGSSMAFSARSMSGSRCSMVWIISSQILVQNQPLPVDALWSRTSMRISNSRASLRIWPGRTPQNGSRSW